MTFGKMATWDADDLRKVFEDSAGDAYPVVLVPNPHLYECYYGYFGPNFSEAEQALKTSNIGSIGFTEQARAVVAT